MSLIMFNRVAAILALGLVLYVDLTVAQGIDPIKNMCLRFEHQSEMSMTEAACSIS